MRGTLIPRTERRRERFDAPLPILRRPFVVSSSTTPARAICVAPGLCGKRLN
jgi:hypothetical protein